MKEPIVLKADVPLDSNTNRSELLRIIAPEILGLYEPLQGKMSPHSSPLSSGSRSKTRLGRSLKIKPVFCIHILLFSLFILYYRPFNLYYR